MIKFRRLTLLIASLSVLLLLAVSPLAAQESKTLTFMFWGDPNAPA